MKANLKFLLMICFIKKNGNAKSNFLLYNHSRFTYTKLPFTSIFVAITRTAVHVCSTSIKPILFTSQGHFFLLDLYCVCTFFRHTQTIHPCPILAVANSRTAFLVCFTFIIPIGLTVTKIFFCTAWYRLGKTHLTKHK
jgi:hypothetical protein